VGKTHPQEEQGQAGGAVEGILKTSGRTRAENYTQYGKKKKFHELI
jgi:hypothetical protein